MAKMGRPRVKIDWEQMDKLCAMQCLLTEIAAYFRCSIDSIERACKREHRVRFAEYYAEKSAAGHIALRRVQMQTALKGNVQMQIWLGKQQLNQSEKVTTLNKTELSGQVAVVDKETVRAANEELESEC